MWKNAKGKLDGETSARERKDIHSEKMTAHMRDFSVIIPLFVFGAPPSTRVHKVQRCLHTLGTDSERKGEEGESGSGGSTDGGDTGSHLTVETYTMTPDVPFGDSFNVIDKWTLRGDGCAPGRGPGKVEVSISVAVSFVKSSMALSFVKGKIENGTQENTKKEFTAWIETARAWMQENPSIVQQADCSIEEFAREHAHKYAPSGAQVSTTNTNTNATAAGDEAKLDNKRQSDGGDARGRSPATSSSTSSSKEYLSEQQEKLLSQLSGLGVGIPSVTSLQAASASPTVQVLTVCTLIALLLSVAPSLAPSLFSWAPYVLILVAILLFYFAPPSLMIMMRDHIERRLAQTHQQASSSSRPPKIQRTKCETLSFPTTRSAPSSSSSSSSISSPARRELSSERTEAEPHSLRRRQM